MVKHSIQHNLHACIVNSLAYLLEVLICSKPAVNQIVIPCVISMGIALKYRIKHYACGSQLLNMRNPVKNP